MNLMATTNHSDNKTKLIVFISSSCAAFSLIVKSLKQSLRAWNLIMN